MQIPQDFVMEKQILIFKTNVSSLAAKNALLLAIEDRFQVDEANLDLDDIDKVLRLVTEEDPESLLHFIRSLGTNCSELE